MIETCVLAVGLGPLVTLLKPLGREWGFIKSKKDFSDEAQSAADSAINHSTYFCR